MSDESIGGLRRRYERGALTESLAGDDPTVLFSAWMEEALRAGLHEPTGMALATADARGRPSVRIVLLKALDTRGLVFYTNFDSRKGVELAANPYAGIVLWWDRLERQVRVEGKVSRVSDEEADAYFASRPLRSRLAAWASPQSGPVEGRDDLERRMAEAERRFADGAVPRPPFWGGLRVEPESIEFWQGRPDRLHDRLVFRRAGESGWRRERLGP